LRLIVYNPGGGAALWGCRLRAALRELQALPGGNTLVATEGRDMVGPIRRALHEHPDATQIVACGGDGTVGACAAALDGRRLPIAVIPTGTTNVLAFELGIPANPVRAARLLAGSTHSVAFRTWTVNGHPLLLQLGVGFDGLLMWRTPRRVKRALGFIGVILSALRYGVTFDYPKLRVIGELEDASRRSAVVTSVMVANAKRWAGPQLTVPSADPTDDLVDVLLLTYQSFHELATFWIAILFPDAPHLRLAYVEHVRMRRLRIEAMPGERAVEAHLDGEPGLMTPLDVEPLGYAHLLAPSA
jgi:diacylglycerol kinase family enzyme